MPFIKRTACVEFDSLKMYDLVNDLESYPDFLPWCKSVSVHKSEPTYMQASIAMAKGPLQQQFTTDNTLDKPRSITINLVSGPFRKLQGKWLFQDNEAGCKVDFEIDFEFSNKLIAKILTPIFSAITGTLVDSFCKEARKRYL